jgi:cob(I)alamin adenosyltransferase
MLYTKKGDKGTTKLFNTVQGIRVSKSEDIFEALGTLDELNASLGFAKTFARTSEVFLMIKKQKFSCEQILHILQQNLFFIQAELGGAEMHIQQKHVLFLEETIYEIETLLPPITSFIVPGGGECATYLEVTRTISRRAERRCVLLQDKKEKEINPISLEFLNRLSSVLYALARYVNYVEGYTESKPSYT